MSRYNKRNGGKKYRQTKLNRLGGLVGLGARAFSAYRNAGKGRVGKGGKRMVGGRRHTKTRGHSKTKAALEVTSQKREFANAPGTISKFVEKHRRHKGYAKLIGKMSLPRWIQLDASQSFSLTAGNQQFYTDLYSFFNVSDLQNLLTQAGGVNTQGAVGRTTRVYVEHYYGSITFTNTTNTTTILHIYDTRFKKKQGSTQSYVSPFITSNLGQQDEQNSTATNPLSTYGMKPGDSLAYRDRCVSMGHTQIMLGPGEVHKHQFFYQVNRMLNEYELQDCTTYVPGWTRWCSVIAHGTPAIDSNRDAMLTPLECAVVMESRMRYRFVNTDQSKLGITNFIPVIGANTMTVIDEKTGSKVAYDQV